MLMMFIGKTLEVHLLEELINHTKVYNPIDPVTQD